MGFIIFIFCLIILIWIIFGKKKIKTTITQPDNFQQLLQQHVPFYRSLNEENKKLFEEKIKNFLSYITITGVNTTVDDFDKLLVASSAVIPIFGFPSWHYYNLKTVLLYEDAFTEQQFSTTDKNRNVLGMVGTGAMQQMMILSKPALHQGFSNETDKNNTGIHEFVHLLDKADGDTDGVPEQLLMRQYAIPWLNLMNESIEKIKKGKSDINIYGATSKTEFFAVASEYFFERPDLLQQKHPELFQLLEEIFHQRPETIKRK